MNTMFNKNELKTGDVLNCHYPWKWYKPLRYISAAIRFFTKSYWNHTAIIINEKDGLYVYEAEMNGVGKVLFDEWAKDKIISVYRPTFKVSAVQIFQEAEIVLNKGYDFSSLLFYQLIYILSGVWIGRKGDKAKDRMYCSEYIAYIYRSFVPVFREWWIVVPDEIYEQKGFFEELYKGEAKKL